VNVVVRPASPAQSLGEFLMQALTDKEITPEKLKIILDARKEIMADQRREAFHAAFNGLTIDLPFVDKFGTVELIDKEGRKKGSYKFARWEDMQKVLKPILAKHGFSMSFFVNTAADGRVMVGGKLMHTDGHFEQTQIPLPPDAGPGRNALQAVGSSLSYGKRYVAELLLNVVRKGEDDDGIGATLKMVSQAQIADLSSLCAETNTKPKRFLEMFVTGATDFSQIPARDYPRLKNALEEKKHGLSQSKRDQPRS
jgi:hypothetical protein